MNKKSGRQYISIILAVVMILSTLACTAIPAGAADTAETASTIVYEYAVTNDTPFLGMDGIVHYPNDALTVNKVVVSAGSDHGADEDMFAATVKNPDYPVNAETGETGVYFQGTCGQYPVYNCVNGLSLVTVTFNVIGEYNPGDIYCEMINIYNADTQGGKDVTLEDGTVVSQRNLPFYYQNIIDGVVISGGYEDLDGITASYTTPTEPATSAPTEPVTTEPATSEPTEPATSEPATSEPTEPVTTEPATTEPAATEPSTVKTYTVKLNGTEVGTYQYKDIATVKPNAGTVGFVVNGKVVYVGTEYSFFVVSDMDITTQSNIAQTDEYANITLHNSYVDQESKMIHMEMVASANVKSFQRIGVAFAKSQRTAEELTAAVKAVSTNETTEVYNGIAVHNSTVNAVNMSGQYQFIYAPYTESANITENTTLYFYAFAVDADGKIYISEIGGTPAYADVILTAVVA